MTVKQMRFDMLACGDQFYLVWEAPKSALYGTRYVKVSSSSAINHCDWLGDRRVRRIASRIRFNRTQVVFAVMHEEEGR